ncbi:MAG TPA: S8 family serine peptidase [Anaerolineae bacterium]|nr:S8 family serine peptidase [Anaerolineae bacterium]
MKKLFWVALCVGLLVCGLVACGRPGTPVATPTAVITKLPTPQYSDYVAILVVDDFNSPRNTEPPATPPVTDKKTQTVDGLCVAALREQEVFIGRGGCLGNYCGRPHGELVYEEIKTQIISYTHFITFTSVPTSPALPEAWRMEMGETREGNILLVAVDTQGFKTSVIRDQIATVVSKLTSNNLSAPLEPLTRGMVLNMSFVFVPCQRIADAQVYLRELGRSGYDLQFITDMQNDPLYNFVIGETKGIIAGVPTVVVAAAGNESADFPYAPAILPNIISVSASPVGVPDRVCLELSGDLANRCLNNQNRPVAWYSNYGKVALDGNHSTATVTLTDTFPITITIPLPGTSFAAPKMSFMVAKSLLRMSEDSLLQLRDKCPSFYPLNDIDNTDWKNENRPLTITDNPCH